MTLNRPFRFLAFFAFALSACAGPAAVATEPPTAPPETPTATVAAESTRASSATEPLSINNIVVFDPRGLASDADGQLYVSECGEIFGPNQVVKIDRSGFVAVVAGEGPIGFSGDGGPALSALLNCPAALAFDSDGNLYVADSANYRIRRIDRDGIISTVAGSGPAKSEVVFGEAVYGYAGDGGPATLAKLAGDGGMAVDAAGNLYIADALNIRVRKVDRQGIITTVAGNGTPGFSGDGGPATAAQLARPVSLAFGPDGSLYVADDQIAVADGGRIRKIDENGVITTFAGGGEPGGDSDGRLAVSIWLRHLGRLDFDDQGSLYFVESELKQLPAISARYNVIRKVARDGIITTVLKSNP